MMSLDEAHDIVVRHLDNLVGALALPDHRIGVTLAAIDNGAAGECDLSKAEYGLVTITIDPSKHEDERGIIETITHELLHIALVDLEHYRNVMISGGIEGTAEARLWHYAVEGAVRRLTMGIARHAYVMAALATKDEDDE